MNIYDLFTANNIKQAYERDTNRQPYEGEAFFPSRKQKGLKFEFVKGKQGVPVALVSANWNTNVLYRDRIGLEALAGKLPFFKEAYKIDEETRQELLSTVDAYANEIIDRIFDDELELLDGAEVTVERMRMQLLSTGTITITENGVNKQYDYGFNSANQYKTLETTWDDADATPLKDLYNAKKDYKTLVKKEAKICVISSALFSKLANSKEVLDYFASQSTPNLYPSESEIRAFVERKFDLRFVILDKVYLVARDFNGTPVPFYPEDVFTLLASADLGETLYGTTPEEADLLSKNSKASSVAVTSKGVAITTWNEVDPVNVNTKVSEVVIPTCPNIDQIYIVKAI